MFCRHKFEIVPTEEKDKDYVHILSPYQFFVLVTMTEIIIVVAAIFFLLAAALIFACFFLENFEVIEFLKIIIGIIFFPFTIIICLTTVNFGLLKKIQKRKFEGFELQPVCQSPDPEEPQPKTQTGTDFLKSHLELSGPVVRNEDETKSTGASDGSGSNLPLPWRTTSL
jgi:hypothetical protein